MRFAWPSVADIERADLADLPAILAHLSALSATITTRLLAAPASLAASEASAGDTLLDAETVAARLSVPKAYVYELCRRGKLPYHRLGKKYVRISERALAGFLEKNADGPRRMHQRAG